MSLKHYRVTFMLHVEMEDVEAESEEDALMQAREMYPAESAEFTVVDETVEEMEPSERRYKI